MNYCCMCAKDIFLSTNTYTHYFMLISVTVTLQGTITHTFHRQNPTLTFLSLTLFLEAMLPAVENTCIHGIEMPGMH